MKRLTLALLIMLQMAVASYGAVSGDVGEYVRKDLFEAYMKNFQATQERILDELKEMTSGVVRDVKTNKAGMLCPVCRKGMIIRGNTRYGCSRWREGCTYAEPF